MRNDRDNPPTRDAKGRWLKGHCPNSKGRPRKKAQTNYDPGDIRLFSRAEILVMAGGQSQIMDRRAALLHKMFEEAMRGKVTTQRFLLKEFERWDKRLAATRLRHETLMMRWVLNNPDFRGLDADNIPREVRLEIEQLEAVLHYYHPEKYRAPPPTVRGEDDDEC